MTLSCERKKCIFPVTANLPLQCKNGTWKQQILSGKVGHCKGVTGLVTDWTDVYQQSSVPVNGKERFYNIPFYEKQERGHIQQFISQIIQKMSVK